jgi:NADH-quinone oxidoreductase subunit L
VLYEALIHGLGGTPLLLVGYAFGLLAVPVTAFYTFRMVFLTFHGEPRSSTAEAPEDVRWNVKGPLAVLGVLAAVTGFVNMVPVAKLTGAPIDYLHKWLDGGFDSLTVHHYTSSEGLTHEFAGYSSGYIGGEIPTLLVGVALSLGLALVGAVLAHRLYNVPEPVEHTEKLGGIKTLLYNNYYQDEYQIWLAEKVTLPVAVGLDTFDQGVVDGVVNGISSVALFAGRRARRFQTGVVSNYAVLLTLGLTVLIVAIGLLGGWFV